MARSEAQKRADRKYRQKKPTGGKPWGTRLKAQEIEQIDQVLKEAKMNKAEFVRWAAEQLREKLNGGG